MKNKPIGRKGFTMIELLVVVAIIGILSALVLVSLSSARSKAKDVRLKSSLSQLHVLAEIIVGNNTPQSYIDMRTCFQTGTAVAGSPDATTVECNGTGVSVDALQEEVRSLGIGGFTVMANSTIAQAENKYCLRVRLLNDPTSYVCTDHTGVTTLGSSLMCAGTADCVE